jgi:hypothetical protein
MVMIKTTVYLPDGLKAQLERVAADTGCSEADLIREGIRLAVAHKVPPPPSFGVFASGRLAASEEVDDLLDGFGRT